MCWTLIEKGGRINGVADFAVIQPKYLRDHCAGLLLRKRPQGERVEGESAVTRPNHNPAPVTREPGVW